MWCGLIRVVAPFTLTSRILMKDIWQAKCQWSWQRSGWIFKSDFVFIVIPLCLSALAQLVGMNIGAESVPELRDRLFFLQTNSQWWMCRWIYGDLYNFCRYNAISALSMSSLFSSLDNINVLCVGDSFYPKGLWSAFTRNQIQMC